MKTNRPVTQRQEQQHERALCAAILALKSVEECRSFFRDLCTPAELQAGKVDSDCQLHAIGNFRIRDE